MIATFVVTPLVTVAVLVWVACPVLLAVMVYEPIGIQFVAKTPVVPVIPLTVVGTDPPLMVIVTPATTTLVEVVTLIASFPAVAIAMFNVEVAPEVTVATKVLGR